MNTADDKAATGLDRDEIYFVQSEEDPTALIAKHAGIDGDQIHWDDTNRDRLMRVESVERTGDVIVVRVLEGRTYTFQPMTLDLYNRHVKAQVELSPEFDSTEALKAFYRTRSFG